MRGSRERCPRRIGNTLGDAFVRTPDGGMACAPAKHECRNLHRRQSRRRKRNTVGRSPVQDVDGGRLACVIAHPFRPRGERAQATIEVDHQRDRACVAGLEGADIGVAHLPIGPVVLIISGAPENFRGRCLDNCQTQQLNAIPDRDGERREAAERMADQMRRPTCASDDRFDDLGLVGDVRVGGRPALSRAAVTEQAGHHAPELVVPVRDDRTPRGAGTA
jgi:hypothetical protein